MDGWTLSFSFFLSSQCRPVEVLFLSFLLFCMTRKHDDVGIWWGHCAQNGRGCLSSIWMLFELWTLCVCVWLLSIIRLLIKQFNKRKLSRSPTVVLVVVVVVVDRWQERRKATRFEQRPHNLKQIVSNSLMQLCCVACIKYHLILIFRFADFIVVRVRASIYAYTSLGRCLTFLFSQSRLLWLLLSPLMTGTLK